MEKSVSTHIYVVLDKIRSAYNVGSFFRTSDGVGICTILICGYTATPENPRVLKTSLGAEKSVPWKKFESSEDAYDWLKERDIPIYSVETTEGAENYKDVVYPEKVALVFGHEIDGVDDSLLSRSDKIVEIPMSGEKNSLNVAVTGGIILYEVSNQIKKKKI